MCSGGLFRDGQADLSDHFRQCASSPILASTPKNTVNGSYAPSLKRFVVHL
jgi:hypothetical protein